jgi:phosphatidate cytidylyltransferase
MRETIIRSLSGFTYVSLLAAALFYSKESLFVFFAIACLGATYEYCNLLSLQKNIPLCAVVAVIAVFYFVQGIYWLNFVLLALSFLGIFYGLFFLFSKKTILPDKVKWLLLFGYIISPFLLLTQIPFARSQYQPEHLFAFFILIWINDTFAFLIGKLIGRHKLMAHISPKKTIEGFAGGFVFSIAAAAITGAYYLNESAINWMLIAIIIGIFGPLGDLFESKLKRIAGLKDSGQIMPGHGGVLDRLDSVIFSAPFVFLFLQFYNYVS